MAASASFLSSPIPLSRHRYYRSHHHLRLLHGVASSFSPPFPRIFSAPNKSRSPVVSSSSTGAPFEELNWSQDQDSLADNSPKISRLSALIQEIEPMDVSLIQKDVPLTTIDAMKRTISGMLGLLPSDQFHVYIEALWEPLSKLLVSSMMTGYTLRNADYRLCLEKNLDMPEQSTEHQTAECGVPEILLDSTKKIKFTGESDLTSGFETILDNTHGDLDIQGLGDISHEARAYILHLQSRLSSAKKELHEVKLENGALQMQQFVGEEKNDLLDYLRSLQPEKVVELSEPTSPELQETIHSVVHGLLATLSSKMQSQPSPSSGDTSIGTASIDFEDSAELLENSSLRFQPLISLSRDYLARLLFWCMLLGHYLRGLEYRQELMELLSLTADAESNAPGGEEVT